MACATQLPRHDPNAVETRPQPGSNGFTFAFPSLIGSESPSYTSPFPLPIVISGPNAFTGFLISVFSTRTGQRIGRIALNDTVDSQFVCSSYCRECAITHTQPSQKRSVAFTWTPPESAGAGDVTVNVTIVVTQSIVYVFSYLLPERLELAPPSRMLAPVVNDASASIGSSGTDVTIGWQKPFNGSHPILFYLVSMRTVTLNASTFAVVWQGLAYAALLTALQAGTVYEG